MNRKRKIVVVTCIVAFIFAVSSCNFSNNNIDNTKNRQTAPITYEKVWEQKTDLADPRVRFSRDGKRIFVYSTKYGNAVLFKGPKIIREYQFKGYSFINARIDNSGHRMIISLVKKVPDQSFSTRDLKLLFIDDKGKVLWQNESRVKGYYEQEISPQGDRILVSYFPAEEKPSSKNFTYFQIISDSGTVLQRKDFDYTKNQLTSINISPDFKRTLQGVVRLQTDMGNSQESQLLGEDRKRLAFTKSKLPGTYVVAKFFPDNEHFAAGIAQNGELSLYKWSQTKPFWRKKLTAISSIQVSPKNRNILSIADSSSTSASGGESFYKSAATLFSSKGKKLWEHVMKSSTLYDIELSPDGKKVSFVSSDPKKPSLLFTKLAKGSLPQKLPKNTSSVAFSKEDSEELVVATSKGEVILLKIK